MSDANVRTYTAAELATAVNSELGTNLTARTIYFYRTKGILSPLEMIGSQPKFTDKHRHELRAALTMQSTMDRPSLEQISERLQSLDSAQIQDLAAVRPLATREVLHRVGLQEEAALQSPAHRQALFSVRPMVAETSLRGGPVRLRRVEVNPDVWLQVAVDLPPSFVAGLVELVERYYHAFREEQDKC